MATTVEEILVKFTGDASSLAKATDTSKLKTKQLEEEVLTLNRVLENLQKIGAKPIPMDRAMESLTKKAREYRLELEKLNAKDARGGRGSGGGGGGIAIGMAGLSVGGAFGLGAGIAAIRQGSILLTPAVEKLAKDLTGLTQIQREYNEELKRGAVLSHDQARAMAMSDAGDSRRAAHMLNTGTGEQDVNAQMRFWRERSERTTRDIADANRSLQIARKAMYDRDTVGRHLPGVGIGQQMEYETEERNVTELEAKIERLKGRRDSETNKADDLAAGGTALQRLEKSLEIENQRMDVQRQTIGVLKESERIKIQGQARLNDVMDRGGAILTDKDIEKANQLLEQQYQLAKSIEDATERASMKERLRQEGFKMAGRGFRGVEAEVLARNAEGKQGGNAELLKNAYTLEGDALNQKYLPAAVKAQIEIERLDMLHQKGAITAETYARAMLDVAKMTDRSATAASRAGTLSGSAEHYSRIDAYSRVMGQPVADAANLDRARRESQDNPTVKAIRESNSILRKIEAGQGKEGVTLKPSSVE